MQNLLLIENKDKIVGCMWDIFTKHVGHMITIWDLPRFAMKKGGTYIAKDCGHLKNMTLYAQRVPKSINMWVRVIENGSNEDFVSCSHPWSSNVGIRNHV
jgi:hypothetical protein